jgi:hypothetical protein
MRGGALSDEVTAEVARDETVKSVLISPLFLRLWYTLSTNTFVRLILATFDSLSELVMSALSIVFIVSRL